MPSQSLRKSGQFGLPFRKCFPTGQEVLSRNPFVNQVNSDIKCNTLKETLEHGRNPFVNQVNSDSAITFYELSAACRRRNPFVNQVNSDTLIEIMVVICMIGRNPFVNQVNSDNEAMNQWLNNTIYWVAIPS